MSSEQSQESRIVSLEESVTKLEATVSELSNNLQKFIVAKQMGGKTRTKEAIIGNKTGKVTLNVPDQSTTAKNTDKGKGKNANKSSTSTTSNESPAASSTLSKPAEVTGKTENKRVWFIRNYATTSLTQVFQSKLGLNKDKLLEKYKDNYNDKKHTAKDQIGQLRAEAAWVYKDFIMNNDEHQQVMDDLRKKIDNGEYSDNKVEENSTEE